MATLSIETQIRKCSQFINGLSRFFDLLFFKLLRLQLLLFNIAGHCADSRVNRRPGNTMPLWPSVETETVVISGVVTLRVFSYKNSVLCGSTGL